MVYFNTFSSDGTILKNYLKVPYHLHKRPYIHILLEILYNYTQFVDIAIV